MEYTVIVPVYNEEKSLVELCDRVYKAFEVMGKSKDFEILFVDDGSIDSSREIIKKLCNERTYVRSVFFRKNMGKSVCLMAGFLNTNADFVITIDGDLQDDPDEIFKMIEKINEGYDLVSGWKQKRKDSRIRVFGSKLFNYVVSVFGGIRLHDFNCGFKIYRSQVVNNISVYGQYHRFIPLLAHLMGFKVTEIPVSHYERKYGVSRYPMIRYQGFFDLLSILFTYKYRFSPLYFFGILGMFIMFPSLVIVFYLVGKHLFSLLGFSEKYMLVDRPLLTLSTTLCVIGLNIFLTGFVCDFILHYQGRKKVVDLLENIVEKKL